MANQIRTIEVRQINPSGKSLLIFRSHVKPQNQKYFASHPNQISSLISAVLPTEGRAHVTNAERNAVDAAASGKQVRAGRMMLKRTAKSCGSDAPMPASSVREAAQATVSNKHGHREEHEVSRKTIAQGRPVCSGEPVVTTLVCFFVSHARLRVHWPPGFPCALCSQRGETILTRLGRHAPRECGGLP